eukprot:765979-Alexandrium_andersonii.AAC.1
MPRAAAISEPPFDLLDGVRYRHGAADGAGTSSSAWATTTGSARIEVGRGQVEARSSRASRLLACDSRGRGRMCGRIARGR